MAIAHRAVASATQSSATSISVSKPSGVLAGDFLFAIVHADTASKSPVSADATTWTVLNTDATNGSSLALLWRIAVTGEASSYSFHNSDSSTDNFSAIVDAYSGVDNTVPIDDGWIDVDVTASATTFDGPSVERRMKNMMMLAVLGIGSNTTVTATPTGYSFVVRKDGFNPGCEIQYQLVAAAGTEAVQSWSINAATAMKTAIVPLRPAATGAVAQSGPKSAAGAVNTDNAGGNAWSNPGNITASDDSRATATVNGTAGTDFLDVTNFGFAIPTNATVVGVGLRIEQRRSGGTTGNCRDNTVQLIVGGSATGSNYAHTDSWLTVDLYDTYGDLDDLWGTTLTPAQVNGTDFGVRIAAQGVAAGANRVAGIDHVQVWVYYNAVQGVGKLESLLLEKRSLVGG